MTPKDWNTQEEAIDAAKAEILAAIGDTDARLELGMVKSIQRGYINSNRDVSQIDIQISEVNINKAIIVITGGGLAGVGNAIIYVENFSANSFRVRLEREGNGSPKMDFLWQVIEFY